MMVALEENRVNQYRTDGFLFPLVAMEPEEAAGLRTRLEHLELRYREAFKGREFNQYLRVNSHLVMALAAEIARTPEILDCVESIIGPDILVWSVEFFIKEPGSDKIVSWHQDMTYWGLGESANGDTDHLISAWVALSPSTEESGCMKFVAGSHKREILPHQDTFSDSNLLSRGQELSVDVAPEEEVPIELKPGEFSIHHGRMFHYSGPNRSGDRRIGCVIRYVSPDVRQLVGQRDYAMLVRGVDSKQNWINIAPPHSDFEPRALELYEKVLSDQQEAWSEGAESVELFQTNKG